MGVIQSAWDTPVIGRPMSAFSSKLRNVKDALKKWNKEIFGNILTHLKAAEEEVLEKELLFELNNSADNRSALFQAQAQYRLCLSREEGFWQQKISNKVAKRG